MTGAGPADRRRRSGRTTPSTKDRKSFSTRPNSTLTSVRSSTSALLLRHHCPPKVSEGDLQADQLADNSVLDYRVVGDRGLRCRMRALLGHNTEVRRTSAASHSVLARTACAFAPSPQVSCSGTARQPAQKPLALVSHACWSRALYFRWEHPRRSPMPSASPGRPRRPTTLNIGITFLTGTPVLARCSAWKVR